MEMHASSSTSTLSSLQSAKEQICLLTEPIKNPNSTSKVIIVGDSAVGKSSIVCNTKDEIISNGYQPTIGFEFLSLYFKIENSYLQMQVWDTCGQEVYRSLVATFFRNSHLALLVYSITDRTSFTNLNEWINNLKQHSCNNIFLIGNKVDDEIHREVSYEEGKQFALQNNIAYFKEISVFNKNECSCKEVFMDAARELFYNKLKVSNEDESINSVSLNKSFASSTNGFTGCLC